MSLQAFVWAIRSLTLCVAIAFGLLVSLLDPSVIGNYGSILFYTVGGILVFLILYLLVIGTQRIFLGDEKAVLLLGNALRQAVIITFLLFLILFLWKYSLLYWWSGAFVVVLGLLVEFSLRKPGTQVTIQEE